jgi:hypothetical protein
MVNRPIGIAEHTPLNRANKQDELTVYPNPAVDFTTLELNLATSNSVTIYVRDMNGRLVNQLRFSRLPAGIRDVRIETGDLANGTYLITAQIGDAVRSGRLVVKR